MKHFIIFTLLTLFVLGCSSNQESARRVEQAQKAETSRGQGAGGFVPDFTDDGQSTSGLRSQSKPEAPKSQTVASVKTADLRKVVRTGSISVRVEDAQAAEKSVGELLSTGPGYIETSNYSGYESGSPAVKMKIRVPSGEFESFMDSLSALGIVLDKKIETKDVTAEIADFGAVIKTLLAMEESLRETLRATRNPGEIVGLQERLTEVRTQIDRIKAQEKALSAVAELSTIDVTLKQQNNTAVQPNDPDWFGQNVSSASASFMTVFRGVTTLFTWIIVFSPFWLTAMIVGSLVYRRHLRKPPLQTQ